MKCYGYKYSKGDESSAKNTEYHHADFILTSGDFEVDFKRFSPCSISCNDDLYYDRSCEGIRGFLTHSKVGINHEVFSHFVHQAFSHTYTTTLSFHYKQNSKEETASETKEDSSSEVTVRDRLRDFSVYILDNDQTITIVNYSITLALIEPRNEKILCLPDSGNSLSYVDIGSPSANEIHKPIVEELQVIKLDHNNIVSIEDFISDVNVKHKFEGVEDLEEQLRAGCEKGNSFKISCNKKLSGYKIIPAKKENGEIGIYFPEVLKESYKVRFHEEMSLPDVYESSFISDDYKFNPTLVSTNDTLKEEIYSIIGQNEKLKLQFDLWFSILSGSPCEIPNISQISNRDFSGVLFDLIFNFRKNSAFNANIKSLLLHCKDRIDQDCFFQNINVFLKKSGFKFVYENILSLMPEEHIKEYHYQFFQGEQDKIKGGYGKEFVEFKYINSDLSKNINRYNKELLLRYLTVLVFVLLFNNVVPVSSCFYVLIQSITSTLNMWFSLSLTFTSSLVVPGYFITAVNMFMCLIVSYMICDSVDGLVLSDESVDKRREAYTDYDILNNNTTNLSSNFGWLLSSELLNSFISFLSDSFIANDEILVDKNIEDPTKADEFDNIAKKRIGYFGSSSNNGFTPKIE